MRNLPRLLILVVLACLSLTWPACRLLRPSDPKKSVVKIFTTIQSVDFYEPWKPGSTANLEGCGTILSDGRVLTTAHLVNKGNYIEVQKFGETKKYVAKVDQLGYDLDLALLKVEDAEFAKGTQPAVFGDLPLPGKKVMIQGGDELSSKEDTVYGLDSVWSWEGASFLPALTTNAEIDDKNNGCPVFLDGKFVGLPFDSWHKGKKTGTLLPVNLVERFLKAVEKGRDYDGLPDLAVYVQGLENPALRNFYHLTSSQTGVVVTQILFGGSAEGLLKVGDVLTVIDGHKVDNEGYTTLGKWGRVQGDYSIPFRLPGEQAEVEVLRDGKELKLKLPLKPIPRLVPYRPDNRRPTYFMAAGFVFVPLTYNYLQSVDTKNLKPSLKEMASHGVPAPDHKQVVLLSHVLPHDINNGYAYFNHIVLDKVNGKAISEMKDLIAAFDHPQGDYHVLEFEDHAWFGSVVVIDAKKAKAATREIMNQFKIAADRSDDLK